MVTKLEKLSHRTSNPDLDSNTECKAQMHQFTIKRNVLLNILEEDILLSRRIPNSARLGLVFPVYLEYKPH